MREGVPATAIAVVGRGEQSLADPDRLNFRELQNRGVEIINVCI